MQIPTTRWARVGQGLQVGLDGVAGFTLFLLMLLTTVDVAGRYFFNAPVRGSVELTQLMLAAVVFLALPTVCWREEHVSIDLLDAVYPKPLVWLRQLVINLLSSLLLWVMTRRVWALGERAFEWGDVTEFLRINTGYLIYLMAIMLAVSALLTLLRAVGYLLEGVGLVKRGGPLSPGGNND